MNKLTLIAFSLSLPFLSACSPSPWIPDISLPTFYKDDIQQGSVLERFKINQLKVGMSKTQVKGLIGSPSIIDPFHNNQWDYINHSTLHEKADIHYHLILKFSDEKLILINTTGIESLSALTDKEKTLEYKRITDEKAAIEVAKQADIKAKKLANEKVTIEVAKQADIKAKKLANEKAKAETKQQKTSMETADEP